MKNKEAIEEILECAIVNINNIPRGIPWSIARWQVEEALKLLRGETTEHQAPSPTGQKEPL